MRNGPVVVSTVQFKARGCNPRSVTRFETGEYSIDVLGRLGYDNLYLTGTLDELAKFVQDLANVVREINARELAASATA